MNFVTEFEERVDKVEKQLDRLEELMVDIKVSLKHNQLKFEAILEDDARFQVYPESVPDEL